MNRGRTKVGLRLVKRSIWWFFPDELADAEAAQHHRLIKMTRGVHEDSCFAYAITDLCGHIKFGHARKLTDRLASLQCGSALPLLLVWSVNVLLINRAESRNLAASIEGNCHGLLESRRVTGEWFFCCLRSAQEALCSVVAHSREVFPTAEIQDVQHFADCAKFHNHYTLERNRKATSDE